MTDTSRDPKTDHEIARLAYARWESEGRPDGRDKQHWAEAEAAVGGGPENLPENQERLLPGEAERLPGERLEPGAADPEDGRPAAKRRSAHLTVGGSAPSRSVDAPSRPPAPSPRAPLRPRRSPVRSDRLPRG